MGILRESAILQRALECHSSPCASVVCNPLGVFGGMAVVYSRCMFRQEGVSWMVMLMLMYDDHNGRSRVEEQNNGT